MPSTLSPLVSDMRGLAQRLRAEAEPKLALARQLEVQAQAAENGKLQRITPQGIDRIRLIARKQWATCPIACGHNSKTGAVVKHRKDHPHMQQQPGQGAVVSMRSKKRLHSKAA